MVFAQDSRLSRMVEMYFIIIFNQTRTTKLWHHTKCTLRKEDNINSVHLHKSYVLEFGRAPAHICQ